MAIDVSAAAAREATGRRWRVTLDRADALPLLRDYLRRLGLAPDAQSPLVLVVDDEGQELEASVGSWVSVNRIPVRVDPFEEVQRVEPIRPTLLPPPRIGELLVRKGFITKEQLEWALDEAKRTNELLGLVLLRQQLIFEDELARTLSHQLDVPYISIMRCGVNEHVARLLPYEVGMQAAAIPVRGEGGTVQVAFADPTDPAALAAVRSHLPHITVAVAELSDIRAALRTVVKPRR
jgi:hypothetical protein